MTVIHYFWPQWSVSVTVEIWETAGGYQQTSDPGGTMRWPFGTWHSFSFVIFTDLQIRRVYFMELRIAPVLFAESEDMFSARKCWIAPSRLETSFSPKWRKSVSWDLVHEWRPNGGWLWQVDWCQQQRGGGGGGVPNHWGQEVADMNILQSKILLTLSRSKILTFLFLF